MDLQPDDPYLDIPPPRPSFTLAFAMITVGVLFLVPFALISLAGGAFFSLQSFLDALLTVGWTFFLGVVFLLFGLRRWKEAKAWQEAYGGSAQ